MGLAPPLLAVLTAWLAAYGASGTNAAIDGDGAAKNATVEAFPGPFWTPAEALSPPGGEWPFGPGDEDGRDPHVRVALNALARNNAKQADQLPKPGEAGTCAVVGNSGVLAAAAFGGEIDAHDVVIRFNSAPVKKYETQVGSKTTFRFMYHSWETKFLPKSLPERAVVTLFGRPGLDFFSGLRGGASGKRFPMPLDRVLVLSPAFLKAVHERLAGGLRRWASSGAVGTALALHLCGPGRVDLYGFDTTTGGGVPMHYWRRDGQPNPDAVEHANDPATFHDYEAERRSRAELERAGAIRVRR